jgi:hypothetical protein
MKKVFLVLAMVAFAGLVPRSMAQDKPKQDDTAKASDKIQMTQFRVQVVFTELEGEKKISSLPYTFLVNAGDGNTRVTPTTVRMGLRVPVFTMPAGSSTPAQYQYVDMGTNLDGRVEKTADGRFALHLGMERTSAYSPVAGKPVSGKEPTSVQPVIQQFRSNSDLLFRDGQTIQASVSTDPVTGNVLKVDVTLNVLK